MPDTSGNETELEARLKSENVNLREAIRGEREKNGVLSIWLKEDGDKVQALELQVDELVSLCRALLNRCSNCGGKGRVRILDIEDNCGVCTDDRRWIERLVRDTEKRKDEGCNTHDLQKDEAVREATESREKIGRLEARLSETLFQLQAIDPAWKMLLKQTPEGTIAPGRIHEMSDALAGTYVAEKTKYECGCEVVEQVPEIGYKLVSTVRCPQHAVGKRTPSKGEVR